MRLVSCGSLFDVGLQCGLVVGEARFGEYGGLLFLQAIQGGQVVRLFPIALLDSLKVIVLQGLVFTFQHGIQRGQSLLDGREDVSQLLVALRLCHVLSPSC